jgi:hypothetical protein
VEIQNVSWCPFAFDRPHPMFPSPARLFGVPHKHSPRGPHAAFYLVWEQCNSRFLSKQLYMSKWACRANPARARSGPVRRQQRAGLRAQARHGDPLNGPCWASSPVGLNVSCRPLAQIPVKINYTNNVTAIRHTHII